MTQRKRNVAGYVDELGRFRPIRSPQFVGTPKRRAKPRDRKKYSRAKAGDLGKARQLRAREDVFTREIRLQQESRAAKEREMKRIEREFTGDQSESGKGRTLVEFVRSAGGIKPSYKFGGKANRGKRVSHDLGELEPLGYKQSGKRGLVSEKGKKSLDGMFQAAREAGYGVGDMWDLIDKMDTEIKGGNPTYANYGYLDYRGNPKANGVLVGDTDRRGKSDLYIAQLGPRSFGVFLKTYLLKRFATKAAAETHLRSIRARVKKNPSVGGIILEQLGGRKFLAMTGAIVHSMLEGLSLRLPRTAKKGITHVVINLNGKDLYDVRFISFKGSKVKDVAIEKDVYFDQLRSIFELHTGLATSLSPNPSAARLAKAAISVFDNDLDLDVDAKDVARLKRGEKKLRTGRPRSKKNPDPLGMFANAAVGIASALQIKEYMNRPKRKRRPARKTNGTTTAKRRVAAKNPHGEMPSGAKFNEKLFDRDLAAIEEGNYRLVRSANAHGRLAGYSKREVEWLVHRAKLASRLKSKLNPADLAKLAPQLKTNGIFKRMLARRKAASALKRELRLEHALEKARAKKRKAIASATANPPRSAGKAVTRSANPRSRKVDWKKITKNDLVYDRGSYFETEDGRVIVWDMPEVEKALAFLRKKVRSNRKVYPPKKKGNPKANPPRSRTFEKFQGRPVTTAKAMPISRHAPARVAQLGDLIELKLKGGQTIKPNPKRFKLCAANGKLWIAGGKFAKANPKAAANEINPIAEISHVVYGTRKPHHGDHSYTHYIHKLGEESGKRPILAVDREGFPVIRGGNYKIEARGIVD